jgi:hypothetical protein
MKQYYRSESGTDPPSEPSIYGLHKEFCVKAVRIVTDMVICDATAAYTRYITKTNCSNS